MELAVSGRKDNADSTWYGLILRIMSVNNEANSFNYLVDRGATDAAEIVRLSKALRNVLLLRLAMVSEKRDNHWFPLSQLKMQCLSL